MTLTELLEHLEVYGEEALLMEPRAEYDECIVGIGYRFHDGPLAIYSVERVLSVLQDDGMDEEDAIEWFDFNIIGGWNGPGTPMYIRECEMRTDGVIANARLGCVWPEGGDGEDQNAGMATETDESTASGD